MRPSRSLSSRAEVHGNSRVVFENAIEAERGAHGQPRRAAKVRDERRPGFVMLERWFKCKRPAAPMTEALQVGARAVPLLMVHHPRARRYLLRLRPDGTVRLTIPRRGTVAVAQDFALRNIACLEQEFQRLAARPKTPAINITASWCGQRMPRRGFRLCPAGGAR